MPIVSNTSPVLNLALIGMLDLLRQQFDRILIPPAVLTELRIDTELPGVNDGMMQRESDEEVAK